MAGATISFSTRALAANIAIRFVSEVDAVIAEAKDEPHYGVEFYRTRFMAALADFHNLTPTTFEMNVERLRFSNTLLVDAAVRIVNQCGQAIISYGAGVSRKRIFYADPANLHKQLLDVSERYLELIKDAMDQEISVP
jgi:hypothetical protein